MRPTRPQGAGYVDLETRIASTRTTQNEPAESIGRMIDWCLGLEIDSDDKDIILLARRNLVDDEFPSTHAYHTSAAILFLSILKSRRSPIAIL